MTGAGSGWDLVQLLTWFFSFLFWLFFLLDYLGYFCAEEIYRGLVKRYGWDERAWPEDVSYEMFWDVPVWLHWLPRGTHRFLSRGANFALLAAVLLGVAVGVHRLFG